MSQIDKLKKIISIYENIVQSVSDETYKKLIIDLVKIKEIEKSLKLDRECVIGETTINATIKVNNHNLIDLENWLNNKFTLISFTHLQDTNEMYKNDPIFKKMTKDAKIEKNRRLDYIIKNNYKYETNISKESK
jgi:hypothetical protein